MPEFFGDERHNRVYHLEKVLKELKRSLISLRIDRRTICRFHKFKIPGAEIIPEELVDSHQCIRNPELCKMVVYFSRHSIEFVTEPLDSHFASITLFK